MKSVKDMGSDAKRRPDLDILVEDASGWILLDDLTAELEEEPAEKKVEDGAEAPKRTIEVNEVFGWRDLHRSAA